ncbi:PepSY-associated TM helix domain-containing protein [Methylomonas sp. AM2-LC]|uniref:PepSY-associated TM helix domain-containing protein n=1 Tax=Methylomonas sp. AM2-LC TaxID=3153301 RepID=UPI003266AA38
MTRKYWVLLHRYSGLYMAAFLLIAGLTGSILAFYPELDAWLNPDRYYVAVQDQAMLDSFSLRTQALALVPQAQINTVTFKLKPGQVYEAALLPNDDANSDVFVELPYTAIRLNPYTGSLIELVADQDENFWPLTRHTLLNFIYKVHFSLALGETGVLLFGIAALFWTINTFVGFYLTLPLTLIASDKTLTNQPQPGFWQRWAKSWQIKCSASRYRLYFDLHRAGGLWVWLLLLVFAWSAVSFNLRKQVYQPVMSALFDLPEPGNFPPISLPHPKPTPGLDWSKAYIIAQQHMLEQSQLYGLKLIEEQSLSYLPDKGLFAYTVRSDKDINNKVSDTSVFFDADSGDFVAVLLPSGQNTGTTITRWLVALHTASVWGLPYKILVSGFGLVVAMLSITGVYIWWQKRRAKQHAQAQRRINHHNSG